MTPGAHDPPPLLARSPWRRGGPVWWSLWLALTVVGAIGLSRLRINNSLQAWAPRQEASEGVATYLVVGFESSRADAAVLERAIHELPSVAWCIGPASEGMLRATGITPERLVRSDDHRYSGVYCFAKPGTSPEAFYREVNAVLARQHPNADEVFALSGSAAYGAALNDVTQRRMPLILTAITIIGGLMLSWLTGSRRSAFAGLAAISCSMIVLLGGVGWLGIDADMSMLLVPPLMISLGYSYAAHAALRRDAAPALTICGVTAVLGIAAFGTTDLPSIRVFALCGSIGIVLVWLCVMSLVARPDRPKPQDRSDRAVRGWLLGLVRRFPYTIVLGAAGVCVLGICLAPALSVDAQPLNYFAPSERIARDTEVLESRLTGTLPFEVIVPKETRATMILEREAIIRKAVEVPLLSTRRERMVWCLADSGELDALQRMFERWKVDQPLGASSFRLRGVAPQLLEVRRQMRSVAAVSIPCMLLVAGVASFLLARSARVGLAGVLVNLAPIAAIVVLGVALSWTCQMPTLMVGAIGIGAGIDDAVHIIWLRRRHSLARSLRICLRACVGSSAIAAVCIAAFGLSPFGPTAQFGLLMSLVLAFAAVADMLVLPALLSIGRWRS